MIKTLIFRGQWFFKAESESSDVPADHKKSSGL